MAGNPVVSHAPRKEHDVRCASTMDLRVVSTICGRWRSNCGRIADQPVQVWEGRPVDGGYIANSLIFWENAFLRIHLKTLEKSHRICSWMISGFSGDSLSSSDAQAAIARYDRSTRSNEYCNSAVSFASAWKSLSHDVIMGIPT